MTDPKAAIVAAAVALVRECRRQQSKQGDFDRFAIGANPNPNWEEDAKRFYELWTDLVEAVGKVEELEETSE